VHAKRIKVQPGKGKAAIPGAAVNNGA
jgi:hypothetical protein